MTSNEKGRALEKAVAAIEELIHRAHPSIDTRTVFAELNVKLDDHGVPHEVDVIVTVDPGRQSQEIHAYECKNRVEPADKNDVILFAHKLKILKAKSGALIARGFTAPAKLQAGRPPVVTLLPVTDQFWSAIDATEWVVRSYDVGSVRARFIFNDTRSDPVVLPLDSLCIWSRQPMTAQRLVTLWVDEKFFEIRHRDRSLRHESLLRHITNWTKRFEPGELVVDGRRVREAILTAPYAVSVRRSRLIAKFNVEGRGTFHEFVAAPDPFEGKVFSLEITTKP